jgi:hypothetical protein
MSEYQYYEFLALDRPLAADEMQQLRAFPTVDRTRYLPGVARVAHGNPQGGIVTVVPVHGPRGACLSLGRPGAGRANAAATTAGLAAHLALISVHPFPNFPWRVAELVGGYPAPRGKNFKSINRILKDNPHAAMVP